MSKLVIYSATQEMARNWAKRNVKAHDKMPIIVSLSNLSALRGIRDRIIIMVNCSIPEDLMYIGTVNTLVKVNS